MSSAKPVCCAACTKNVRAPQQMRCSKCSTIFHAVCVNIVDLRSLSDETKSTWLCPVCASKLPKSDSTPIRSTAAASVELRVPTRNATASACSSKVNTPACSPAMTPEPDHLETLVVEMRLMRDEIGDLKNQFLLLSEHVTARLDEYSTKCKRLEERDSQRELELVSLRAAVSDLQNRLNFKAQVDLLNEVEISGVPEAKGENPIHVAQLTARKIGVNIDDTNLVFAMRAGPRYSKSSNNATPGLPRPLVIRFVTRQTRDEFLKAGKSRRNLTSGDIGFEGASTKIYFNERLTQENRHLFRTVKKKASENGYKYCWIRNGSILVRRREGTQAVRIRTQEDLVCSLGSRDNSPSLSC